MVESGVIVSVGEAGWQELDRSVRRLARAHARLDAEEMQLLREAHRLRIWREVGCSTLLEYIEDRLGYTPRVAQERVRVALALTELPAIAAALHRGELPFTSVRELTRVATHETEARWLDACGGKRVHEIEKLVSGRKHGDLPTDPLDPDITTIALRYDVKPSTAALLRAAKQALEAQRGEQLDDDAFLATLADIAVAPDSEATIARAKFQIAVTTCDSCRAGWSDVAGSAARLDSAELARARCDAQQIGPIDGAAPDRAHQDVTPKHRRFIWRRDRGACRVPGCRATAHLEIHHLVPREAGGAHEPSNLILLCDGHHAALHRGTLSIRGAAPDHLTFERVAPSNFGRAALVAQVKDALVGLGFKPAIAAAAIDAALADAAELALEPLLRAALRQCPRPLAA